MENTILTEESTMDQQLCPHCHEPIIDEDYFCPHCGKKIKDKPLSTSIGKQVVVYLVSIFLPPFGLPWAFRYLKQPEDKSKIIGWIVIGLTVISLVVNIWLATIFINQTIAGINQQLNAPLNSIYSQ